MLGACKHRSCQKTEAHLNGWQGLGCEVAHKAVVAPHVHTAGSLSNDAGCGGDTVRGKLTAGCLLLF